MYGRQTSYLPFSGVGPVFLCVRALAASQSPARAHRASHALGTHNTLHCNAQVSANILTYRPLWRPTIVGIQYDGNAFPVISHVSSIPVALTHYQYYVNCVKRLLLARPANALTILHMYGYARTQTHTVCTHNAQQGRNPIRC